MVPRNSTSNTRRRAALSGCTLRQLLRAFSAALACVHASVCVRVCSLAARCLLFVVIFESPCGFPLETTFPFSLAGSETPTAQAVLRQLSFHVTPTNRS